MSDSENLANSLDQKFKKLIQLHQESLTKIVHLETELEQQKKILALNSEQLQQNFQEQLKNQELLALKNLHEKKAVKQAIGKLIEEIDDCIGNVSASKNEEKENNK